MKRINAPLEDLLRSLNLHDPIAGWNAVELWPRAVGERIAAHARATSFREGVLYVEVDTAAWMNELAYHRRRIAQDLNTRLGREAVAEIRLVPAAGRPNTPRPTGEGT